MHQHDRTPLAESPSAPQGKARWRFLTGMVTGGLLGSLLASGISVYSHGFSGAGGPGGGRHSTRGWHHHDPVTAQEHINFATDWLLSRIDASEAQRRQVQPLVQATVTDLQQVQAQHRAHHQALVDALARPTVDRQTLEELRRAEVQLVETLSTRLVDAIVAVAEVLTPQQRATLIEVTAHFRH